MRSRPEVLLFLRPAQPVPGAQFEAEVVLRSRGDTPIDAVEAHLTGVEQRHARTPDTGHAPLTSYAHRVHVDLVARSPKALLTKGEHRFKFAFNLPKDAPPEYRSQTAAVLYNLNVRVEIPWWPNREARYLIPVVAAPVAAEPSSAVMFCTDTRGPRDEALYIEASLDTATVPIGGVVRGAASFSNVGHHRVRRVDLTLVQLEHAAIGPEGTVEEGHRYVVPLLDGPPRDGEAIPFQVRIPGDATPSFRGLLLDVRWYLEVRAVVTLGRDITLAVPFRAYRPAGEIDAPRATIARVPPVGRGRRALIWAECARQANLANDAEQERMSGTIGPSTTSEGRDPTGAAVELAITLEPRKAGGLALTGALSWPRLGIDLAVTERRWVDAWARGACEIDVPAFAERFTARGREAAQVRAFLDETTCRWLLRMHEAAVGDEGATLLVQEGAQTVEGLRSSVRHITSAARAIADTIARLPPPAAMTELVPAWRAAAASFGGRLAVGDMSIRDAAFDDTSLSIVTEWSEEGEPVATRVRFPMPQRGADAGDEPPALDGPARAIIKSLEPQVMSLEITAREASACVRGPVSDPATLDPILVGLGSLVRTLTGGAARGPYR